MDTLVLLSGGIDSYVLADIAGKHSDSIYGLTFNYMQENDKEIDCAKIIAQDLKFKEHIIIDIDMGIWREKYLNTILVKGTKHDSGNSAYVPARNMIFLSYAIGIADSIGIENIAIGTTIGDFSLDCVSRIGGYPDCHPKFLKDIQVVARDISKGKINIYAPLTNYTKVDIIKYGILNNLDFSKTWSCYTNNKKPCGQCIACQTRIYGFYKLGTEDSLVYNENFIKMAKDIQERWESGN